MKSLLIVTEQFSVGGLETHIRGEIQYLLQNGCQVHLAVGEQCSAVLLPENLSSFTPGLILGPDASLAQMHETREQLRSLIRMHQVEAVHVHPFSSILPAVLAAQAENIPALLTLHGPASLGAYGGFLHEILLQQVVLPSLSATVCVSDEVRRLAAAYVPPAKLHVLPNSVHFPELQTLRMDVDPRWCFVSRLDAAKIVGAFDFVIKAQAAGLAGVAIVGDGPAKQQLQEQVAQAGLAGFVEFLGYQADAPALMAKYAGVAGMGRVLLEGIAARKPVVLVGYDGVKGLLTRELFDQARGANFSGRGVACISPAAWQAQLSAGAFAADDDLYHHARSLFAEDIVWARFCQLLQQLEPMQANVLGAVLDALPRDADDDTPLLSSSLVSDKLEELACSPIFYAPSLLASLDLHRKRAEIQAQQTQQAEQMVQIDTMQKTIDGLNEQLLSLGQSTQQLEQQLAARQELLQERDNQTAALQQTLQAREEALRTSEQALHISELACQAVEQRLAACESAKAKAEALARERLDAAEAKNQALQRALDEAARNQVELMQTLAERETELVEMRQTISQANEQYAIQQQELQRVIGSNSWRMTEPLRVARWRMSNPRIAAYGIARSLYWALPSGVRQSLNEPRHKFVRMVRGSQPPSSALAQEGDLTWEQFSEQVLSQRRQYKGVFVQELVIDWNVPLYQRPQHLAAALGNLGFLVIYKTDNWAGDDVNGFRLVSPGVWITNRREVDTIEGVIRSIYSTAYANTPELLMENGKRGFLIYEYIDHIDPEISGDDGNIKRLLALKEFAFSGGADLIVASARKLYDEAVASVGADKVALVQNGVDTKHYRNPLHSKTDTAENFRAFRARFPVVVGYFGALAPWLWYDAVRELIAQRPDLGFVFIGPDYYGGAAQLPQADNVLYMGAIDYKILPAYARAFDVCFIPFKPGEIARTTSPLKLFEYFALEKPVVVTSEMAECVFYPEVFRGDSAAALSTAIDDAIRVKDDPRFKKRLAQLADENDWGCRARAMTAFLREDV